MPRYAAKVDGNHGEIRDALRSMGIVVFDASAVGGGFADLVCSFGGYTHLVEVKMPDGKPTKAQKDFYADWQGGISTVRDLEGCKTVAGFMKAMAGRLK